MTMFNYLYVRVLQKRSSQNAFNNTENMFYTILVLNYYLISVQTTQYT